MGSFAVDATYPSFLLASAPRCDFAFGRGLADGAFELARFGTVTIHQDICFFRTDGLLTLTGFTLTGFFTIATPAGATITGTLIGAENGDTIRQALTILGRTKRFRHASGCLQLTMTNLIGNKVGISSTNHVVGVINRRRPRVPSICASPAVPQ